MSTILSADDLNDFITPGLACIKPVEVLNPVSGPNNGSAEITIGSDGAPLEEGQALPQAQISLQDCLACSGCITSAEAVLVELQSPKELLKQLELAKEASKKSNNADVMDPPVQAADRVDKLKRHHSPHGMEFVLSVCPQTRASLAQGFNLSIPEVDQKLESFFVETLGFRCVVGTEIGRSLSLEESWRETNSKQGQLTLSSICPGWTLYAEKTHKEIIQYLSTVRSPQQITGHLLKHLLSEELSICPKTIYHVSLMPCFDKKLESARPEFMYDDAREVDLVITAKEFIDMLQSQFDTNFTSIGNKNQVSNDRISRLPKSWPSAQDMLSNDGSGSGGYLAYILAKHLKDSTNSLEVITGKNSDFIEYHIRNANMETIFKGAQVNGFRNIQNIVRKLKLKSGNSKSTTAARRAQVRSVRSKQAQNFDVSDHQYVEVMACPGGCLNGGGQINPPADVPLKQWISDLEKKYQQIPNLDVNSDLYDKYLGLMKGMSTEKLLRTQYKYIEVDDSSVSAISVGTQW